MRTLLIRIRSVFRSRQLDADLDDELKAHIDLAIAENLQQGMTAEEARTAALRAFGGVTQIREAYRVQRGLPWLITAARDLRIAIRQLRRSPGFAITAILTLAFGIGAITAIFSIMEGVLLRPLPFLQPGQLVVLSDVLENTKTNHAPGKIGVTTPEIPAYERYTRAFAGLGGYEQSAYALTGVGAPAEINAARLTASVFPVLGVSPLMGRMFTQQEDVNHVQVTVISYAMWRSRFSGDPNILGRKIELDRKTYEIIGVMPRGFEFPLVPGQLNQTELWTPMSFTADELSAGSAASWCCAMVGRLRPGVTLAQAQQDAKRIA